MFLIQESNPDTKNDKIESCDRVRNVQFTANRCKAVLKQMYRLTLKLLCEAVINTVLKIPRLIRTRMVEILL
jgi:hypothetical protein